MIRKIRLVENQFIVWILVLLLRNQQGHCFPGGNPKQFREEYPGGNLSGNAAIIFE
ncbi:MAG: hypothetical protein PVS2B2_19690 [Candidatus Acidiferrum sp.]